MNKVVSMKSPIGVLTIEGNEEAITRIDLPGSSASSASSGSPRSKGDGGTKRAGPIRRSGREMLAPLEEAVCQLEEYFAGERTEFDLPLEVAGTHFQRDVWFALSEIPYGKTVSYGELAEMVGRPKAFRAVGQANGSNPIPIVLPCHRVVASGGRIGGYGGGLPMKRRLLALEGVVLPD